MRSLERFRPATARPQRRTLQWLALLVSVGILAVASPLVAAWPTPGPTIPDPSIYVTNQLDNTLSVIDGSSYKVVATVPVGTSPAGVAVSPDGRYAYIAGGGDDAVSGFDTGSRTIATTVALPAGSSPAGVALAPDGGSAYVANEVSASVTVINTRSGAVEATIPAGTSPFGVAASPDGRWVYVADLGPGKLAVIDTRVDEVVSTVSIGGHGTDPFNVAATDDAVYVTDQGANALSIIDPRTRDVVTTVTTGNSPYGVAVDPT